MVSFCYSTIAMALWSSNIAVEDGWKLDHGWFASQNVDFAGREVVNSQRLVSPAWPSNLRGNPAWSTIGPLCRLMRRLNLMCHGGCALRVGVYWGRPWPCKRRTFGNVGGNHHLFTKYIITSWQTNSYGWCFPLHPFMFRSMLFLAQHL